MLAICRTLERCLEALVVPPHGGGEEKLLLLAFLLLAADTADSGADDRVLHIHI